MIGRRTVTLRDERYGRDMRALWAYLDDDGHLHIDGQDLGPATAPVSGDGEYEWFQTIDRSDIARLVVVLGGRDGDDVLDLLADIYTGARSYEFERLLRESDINVKRFVY